MSDYIDTDFIGGDSPPPGLKLPGHRYRIIRKLGSGSMGEVYLAEDTKLHRRVAIKSIRADRTAAGQILRRIKRECLLHARIGAHPHIVTLFDLHDEGDQLHLVMEYVDGDTLDHILETYKKQRKPFPIADGVDIAIQCLEGLAHVHARGIIHRDIKPANVMITRNAAGRYTAKIMDFGVARQEEQDPDITTLTHPGGRSPGTPLYMAPEQIDSHTYGPVVPASDLYAVGVLLYQLIAGHTPFTGSLTDVFNGHLNLDPRPIVRPSGTTPHPLLAEAIDKALEKHAHRRFVSAAEFAAELNSIRALVNAGGVTEDSEEEDSMLATAWHGSATRWAIAGLAGLAIAAVAFVGIPSAHLQLALNMLDGVVSSPATPGPAVSIPVNDSAAEETIEAEEDEEPDPGLAAGPVSQTPKAATPPKSAPKPEAPKSAVAAPTPEPAPVTKAPEMAATTPVVQAPSPAVEAPATSTTPPEPVMDTPAPVEVAVPVPEIIPPTPAPVAEIVPPTATQTPETVPPTSAPQSASPVQDATMAAAPASEPAEPLPGLESIQVDNPSPATPPAQPAASTGGQLEVVEFPIVLEADEVDTPPVTPTPLIEEEANLETIVVAKAEPAVSMPSEDEPVANIDRTYNVRSGDTLEIIARRFHLNVDDLMRWNQLTAPVALRPDQRLYLYERPNLAAPAEPSSALDMGKQESRSKEILRKTKERVKEWIERVRTSRPKALVRVARPLEVLFTRPTRILPRRWFFLVLAPLLSILPGCPSLPAPDLTPQPDARDTHLIRLVHITDPQVIDEESPARSVRTESLIAPSWRPQEALAIHTLDATLQRINTLHNAGRATGRPVDFVVMTGDLCDLAQENELQWFMDTMDGKEVTADSGALDGAARNVSEALNPKLPYRAAGLDREIPWFTCYGNHDGLATGTFPIDRSPALPELWSAPLFPFVADALGFHEVDPAWNFMLPAADFSPATITGSVGAPLRDNGTVLDLDALEAGPIEPDAARRFLSRRTFIQAHLESSTLPRGHGFTNGSMAREEVWYSVRPIPEVPVRLIVFNSVALGEHHGLPLYYGVLTRRHFNDFLHPELERAEKAGEWVILASHHPSVDFDLPYFEDRVSTGEFRETLARYPGVVLHLAGHTHRNNASIIPGEHPYIEIETGAIIDYPQEGRMLDLFVAEDGASIRIESRMFSHADAPTTFSAESYRLAEIDFGVRDAKARAKSNGESGLGDPRGTSLDRDFNLRLSR